MMFPEPDAAPPVAGGGGLAKAEFHFAELFPRVGLIVTILTAESQAVVRFSRKRVPLRETSLPGRSSLRS